VIDEFGINLALAYTDFHAALQNMRTDLLLQKSSGWGVVGELAFTALAAVLTDGLEPVVAVVAGKLAGYETALLDHAAGGLASLTAVRAGSLKFMLRSTIGAAKLPLRAKFGGYSTAVAHKLSLITDIQESAGAMFRNIAVTALRDSDDVGLMLARDAFRHERANVTTFTSQINDLMGQFFEDRLDQLGNISLLGKFAGTWEVVRVGSGTHPRYAVIEFRENAMKRDNHGEIWTSDAGQRLLNWVDPRLEDAAITRQLEVHGKLRTIAADDPIVAELPDFAVWGKPVQP
jgi:hypothetical protein